MRCWMRELRIIPNERSYRHCGIPILDAEGVILGTLCHYDVVPRDLEQIDLLLMLSVASALARGNHVRPHQIA